MRPINKQNQPAEVYDRSLATWLLFMGAGPARIRLDDDGGWACLFQDARRVRYLINRFYEADWPESVRRLLDAHQRLGRMTLDAELKREGLGDCTGDDDL